MTLFANLSMTRKLVLYSLLVGGGAIVLYALVDFAWTEARARERLAASTQTTADTLGPLVAAGDAPAIRDLLQGFVGAPGIAGARLQGRAGAPPALAGELRVASAGVEAASLEWGSALHLPVTAGGAPLAELSVAPAPSPAGHSGSDYLAGAAAALTLGLGAVALLAVLLQRMITAPLMALGGFARRVSRQRDYSMRSGLGGKDEIGELAGAIDDLLAQVQKRDAQLEEQVMARTEELVRLNEQLKHQAYHDALTRLPNRALFDDRLTLSMAQADRDRTQLAVLFLDLDNFKTVNDTLGHDIGDEMLQVVADRLRRSVRRIDTVARLGGDEFTVIVTRLEAPEDAVSVVRAIIDALAEPMEVAGHTLQTSASIGISLYPEHGDSATELKRNADTAMYAAKAAGRGTFRFYSSALQDQNQRQLLVVTDLKDAVAGDDLVPLYQPVMDSASGRILEVECLLRWRHPSRGLIRPGVFIGFAEKGGFMGTIQERTLRKAMADLAVLSQSHPDIGMSFNLSLGPIEGGSFGEAAAAWAQAEGVDPARLAFELGEQQLMQCGEGTLKALRGLAERGFRLVIDDFGTNMGALRLLSRLPVAMVKLDRALLRDIDREVGNRAAIEALLELSATLAFVAVAKGVETETQRTVLQDIGCRYLQGFAFYEPMELEQLTETLRAARMRVIA